jgi:hypothetical protein
MPRFRFIAADSTGQVSDGAIDAASETEARNKLASNGLAVRQVEEVAGAAGATPPELPRRTASRSSELVEPLPMKRTQRTDVADAPRGGSRAALPLSIIALVLALAAVTYVVYRDPPWGRLGRYDFRTPEAAYLSQLRIEANADLQAHVELQRKLNNRELREKLETTVIPRTRQFNDKHVLFIRYERKGQLVHEVTIMEKDPEHGDIWKPTFSAEQEIRLQNPALAKEIENWRQNIPMGRAGSGMDD